MELPVFSNPNGKKYHLHTRTSTKHFQISCGCKQLLMEALRTIYFNPRMLPIHLLEKAHYKWPWCASLKQEMERLYQYIYSTLDPTYMGIPFLPKYARACQFLKKYSSHRWLVSSNASISESNLYIFLCCVENNKEVWQRIFLVDLRLTGIC